MTGAGTALGQLSELELLRASESQRVHAGSEPGDSHTGIEEPPREGAGSGQANGAGDASAPDAR